MPTQSRRRTTLTARLILEDADKILMLAQTKTNGDGFTLPGGKIDAAEFAKAALIRECREEIDIVVKKKDLHFAHIVFNKLKGSTELVFFFSANIWTNSPRIVETDKFAACNWISPLELPTKTTATVKTAIERWLKGKSYTEAPKDKKKT
jgi:8-oxo-dGTP diphosphatase